MSSDLARGALLLALTSCSADPGTSDASGDASIDARGDASFDASGDASIDAHGDAQPAVDANHPEGGGCPDLDRDGHRSTSCGGDDCDDADATRFAGNAEVCDAAQHDEDCDPSTFGTRDGDMDGYVDATCCNTTSAGAMNCGDDCNDSNRAVHPTEAEVCNGHDDDCDTAVDEGVGIVFYADCDGDGIGGGAMMALCTPSSCMGHPDVTANGDCNDANAMVRPGAAGACGCAISGGIAAYDMDGDHHDVPGCGGDDCLDTNAMVFGGAPGVCGCTGHAYDADLDGHVALACGGDDCDEAHSAAHGGAVEICDGIDDDCDGTVDNASATSLCASSCTAWTRCRYSLSCTSPVQTRTCRDYACSSGMCGAMPTRTETQVCPALPAGGNCSDPVRGCGDYTCNAAGACVASFGQCTGTRAECCMDGVHSSYCVGYGQCPY